jgi:1A family penicillin-binding protein
VILWIQMSFIIMLIIGIFTMSAFLIWATTIEIPDFSLFETRKVSQSTKIYDRTGKILLYDVHKDVRRTLIEFEKISPNIKNATVAIEDEEFYQHIGIKPTAILRAVLVNIQSGEYSQGGSTITQQVIKNALLSQEKTIKRKVKEWILALKLERIMTKEEILELYLNDAPYGGNIYGIEEASMTYFGKHANEVTLAEAAYLAAIPQAPTRYSPYGTKVDKLEARKNLVLKRMYDLHMISQEEYDTTRTAVVKFLPPQERGIRAPHFVMYIREIIAEKYGEETITEGGLRVTTTIDMDLQQKGEEIVKKYVEENERSFNATNAGLIALDPKTGQILTMVGSRDYFDMDREGNFNTTLARRQPGSAFKPFVYAAAFEQGYTPDTKVFNVRTEFSTHCNAFGQPLDGADESQCYRPENYDHNYNGPVSLRDALAQSMNVPAVKMLYLVGLDKAIDMSQRLGITTLGHKSQYGLTLVLGGGEVTLLEMTSAYGVFGNDGKRNVATGILKVENSDGTILDEYKNNAVQVIPAEIARQVSDVLADNIARTPAFGADSYLNVADRQVAVKTGTTNNYKDAWIIGYTPTITVGAWAGNNDNSPMEKKVAGFIIAPLWNSFFTTASSSLSDERFITPPPVSHTLKPALRGVWYGGTTYKIDSISGKLATEYTPENLIIERVIPNPHEILYWVNKTDPTGPAPINPYNDAQFLLWEIPAQQWIATNGLPLTAWNAVPDGFDNLHSPDQIPKVSFISPSATSTFTADQKIVINAAVTSGFAITHVDFFMNGTFLGSSTYAPYEFAFIPNQTSGVSTTSTIRVVAHDSVGNKGEAVLPITISQSLY